VTTNTDNGSRQGQRVDKWLWCARFFRSRSLAQDAVSGGRVHVNGERVKPSRTVRIGDRLVISRGEEQLEVVVLGIPLRRGPAPEARIHYEETTASAVRREQERAAWLGTPAPAGRPDKHSRRLLRGLRRG
jgi:ribosome-associated heat shock protein Hsp15